MEKENVEAGHSNSKLQKAMRGSVLKAPLQVDPRRSKHTDLIWSLALPLQNMHLSPPS